MRFLAPIFLALLAVALAVGPSLGLPSGTRWTAKRTTTAGVKGAFFMNRINPSTSDLYIADADGSNEKLLLGNESSYDYHATFSPDGKWIVFTSERNGDGNSDLYRVKVDGSGLEKLVASPSVEDAGVLSPNGSLLAYTSTANGYIANLWVKDLDSGNAWNISNIPGVRGNTSSPDGYFRPAWSPDGEWLAFSSDRNTGWYGHGNGSGWEHTQQLSVYVIRPDGTDLRKVIGKDEYCYGTPKWSPDGKRLVFYEMTREATWDARRPEELAAMESSIVSVSVETGEDRIDHASGAGCRIMPSYVGNSSETVGYLVKSGTSDGLLNYTSTEMSTFNGTIRSPAWSPDGKKIVYEKPGWDVRPMETKLYSYDPEWEYRFTDVFPVLSAQDSLAITQKQLGNSSIVTMNPDGTNQRLIFDVGATGQVNESLVAQGLAGAFQPDWSRDGEWIAFGLGAWFQERSEFKAWIYRVKSDGSYFEQLTDNSTNAGFPSFSPAGDSIVYRVFGDDYGLRVLNVTTGNVATLTTERDNLPHYSPDGERIVFTRRTSYTNFDVCTIRPDATDLRVLTESGANDAHAVWSADGSRILYSSGMWGFQQEVVLNDDTFQPYGVIMSMNPDGSDKKTLTDSLWEDSMPLFVPNDLLGGPSDGS